LPERKTNILIIGAGKGGSLLIDLFQKSKTAKILGVADINVDAPGITLAKELGIPTTTDYKNFLKKKKLNEIINVTGSEKVQEELLRLKPLDVELIGGHSAKFIWDIVEERKRMANELRESEKRLRLQINRMPIGCITWGPDFRVMTWNPAAEKIFGFNINEALGKHPYDIIVPKDVQAHVDKIWSRLLEGDTTAHSINENITKDGRKIICSWSNTPLITEDGTVVGVLSMVQDITDHKRLEEQLLQAQKMEAIGQLAGGIAHDFNNILTAIIGFGTLLKSGVEKNDLLNSYAIQILTSAKKAASLTQSLLTVSRKQIISPKALDLNALIRGIENILSRIVGEDVELSIELTDKDLTVMADSTQIDLALMNLVTNAKDAMPDGGSLTITTELVRFDHEFIKAHGYGKPGLYALIAVKDTGEGMNEETKERIFEPFFTTKEIGKGTGLGLSMVYGIIQQHDGYIQVYTELNKGAVFEIYFPVIQSTIKEVPKSVLSPIQRGTETILVAEDDEQVRDLIREILTGAGYTVIEATDGEEALRAFQDNRDEIQLLIFDVVMPKRNGKDVYDEIKIIRPGIKAVFISGYDAHIIHKKEIIEEGLTFISKPISPDVFLKEVREVLDKTKTN
jgi:PAS domain S-box-containing protein